MKLIHWLLLIAVSVHAEDEIQPPEGVNSDGSEAIISDSALEPEPVVTFTPDPIPEVAEDKEEVEVEEKPIPEEDKVQAADPVPEKVPQAIRDFEIAKIPLNERMIIGRVKVIKEGDDITSDCKICLQFKPKDCINLINDRGFVLATHRSGDANFQKMVCNADSKNPDRYFVRGTHFYVDSRQNVGTYFGNLTIDVTPKPGYKSGWAHTTEIEDLFDREVAPFHRAIGKAAQMRYVRSLPRLKTDKPKVVEKKEEKKKESDPMEGEERNARELVYISASIFMPSRSYGGQLTSVSTGKTGGSRYGFELGTYVPALDFKTAWGPVVRLSKDSFDVPNATTTLNEKVSTSVFTIGASGRFYINDRVGDRLYIRGDVGLSKIGLDSQVTSAGAIQVSASSSFGLGYLLGAGYDFPIKRHFRLGAFVHYTSDSAKYKDPNSVEQTWSTTAVSFGVNALF